MWPGMQVLVSLETDTSVINANNDADISLRNFAGYFWEL